MVEALRPPSTSPPESSTLLLRRTGRSVGASSLVQLRADDRHDAGLARGLVHRQDAVHVAVVGDADRGLPVGGGRGHDVADPRRAVEHRVLGVQVQMDERSSPCDLQRCSGAGASAWRSARVPRITSMDRSRRRRPDADVRRSAAAPASSGTSISAAVSEPWAPTSRRSPGMAGSTNPTGACGQERDVAEPPQVQRRDRARARASRRRRAPRASSPTRGGRTRRAPRPRARRRRRARRTSQRNRPSPLHPRTRSPSGREVVPVVADVHLAVVGGDEQRGLGRQRVEQPADERVGERELAREVRVVQPELVRDRVDARVVRVHDRRRRPRRARGSARRAPTVVLQPRNGTSRRCAAVNPDVRNSPRVTTGTDRPRNGGVALHVGTGRAGGPGRRSSAGR